MKKALLLFLALFACVLASETVEHTGAASVVEVGCFAEFSTRLAANGATHVLHVVTIHPSARRMLDPSPYSRLQNSLALLLQFLRPRPSRKNRAVV